MNALTIIMTDVLNDFLNEHADIKRHGLPQSIDRVLFRNPATIVFWKTGEKTVVKCLEGEEYDPEKGLAMCIAKYALGNNHKYYEVFKEHLPKEYFESE